jgi:hypothetical protein
LRAPPLEVQDGKAKTESARRKVQDGKRKTAS